jgi:Cdc6-like AAA superfamily ATPase
MYGSGTCHFLILTFQSDVALATKESVDKLHERQDNREDREEYREIVDWLTPVDFRLQQTDSLRRRQRGTGEWLLKSREFQDFVTEKNQTLFCPGIPGAGKTIITAAVVDHLQSKFQKDAGVAILFVYCSFRRQHEQSCEQLFASLLKQLLQGRSTVPHNVAGLYKRHKENQTRPSLDEILEALPSVMILHSRIFIVVDALDELQASDGRGQKFVSELFKIQNEIGVNIFATSRFIPEIAKDFENKARLEIRASEDDVQMYLDHNISLLPSFVGKREDLQQLVKTAIVKAVDGM